MRVRVLDLGFGCVCSAEMEERKERRVCVYSGIYRGERGSKTPHFGTSLGLKSEAERDNMWRRVVDERGKVNLAGRGARGSSHFGQKRREIRFKIGEREREKGRG